MIQTITDPVLIIAGPTASGKSALAMDAAEEFQGTVINADSMQVYKELRLLTARPSEADEDRVPHRLYGVLPAAEACSVGRWLDMAAQAIREVHTAGGLPIVVGGTGLYLKVLTEGLADIPDIPDDIRQQARARHAEIGGEAFHAELAERDPAAAAKLPSGDSQRLIRAYEVIAATGRSLDDWQAEHALPPLLDHFATLVLVPPRGDLYRTCDERFDWMLEHGALEEVEALLSLKLDPNLPALKAVGVKELGALLDGSLPRDEAVRVAKRVTRNFAKRQLTWLRNQVSGTENLNAQYSERFKSKIFAFIRQFLLTKAS